MKLIQTPFSRFTVPFQAAALGLVCLAATHPASAATIISDTFTGANTTLLPDHTPDINATGGGWIAIGDNGSEPAQISTGRTDRPAGSFAEMNGFGIAAGISLASSGGYEKGTTFTLSADVSPQYGNGSTNQPFYGVGIGFYNSNPSTGSEGILSPSFTGLAVRNAYTTQPGDVNHLGGDLNLIINGVVVETIAFTGTYSNTTMYNLSYTVDATTGLSNVVYAGTSYNFTTDTTAAFTNANTTYVGMGSNTIGSDYQWALVDNFTVEGTIPEPSTGMLIGLVGAGFVMMRNTRRAKALA